MKTFLTINALIVATFSGACALCATMVPRSIAPAVFLLALAGFVVASDVNTALALPESAPSAVVHIITWMAMLPLLGLPMRHIIAAISLSLLGACTTQPGGRSTPAMVRVDPRLLEETNEPAPAWAEQCARDYHQTTKYPGRGFTYFDGTRALAHGGFSARFRKEAGGQANVTYFFDTSGRYMTHRAWICDGP